MTINDWSVGGMNTFEDWETTKRVHSDLLLCLQNYGTTLGREMFIRFCELHNVKKARDECKALDGLTA